MQQHEIRSHKESESEIQGSFPFDCAQDDASGKNAMDFAQDDGVVGG